MRWFRASRRWWESPKTVPSAPYRNRSGFLVKVCIVSCCCISLLWMFVCLTLFTVQDFSEKLCWNCCVFFEFESISVVLRCVCVCYYVMQIWFHFRVSNRFTLLYIVECDKFVKAVSLRQFIVGYKACLMDKWCDILIIIVYQSQYYYITFTLAINQHLVNSTRLWDFDYKNSQNFE